MRKIAAVLTALAALRCGTVVHGGTQGLPVTSNPSGATARLSCADGTRAEAVTPGTLLLRRNVENCSVTVEKSGYRSQSVALRRGKSAAMVGNLGMSSVGAVLGIVTGLLACGAVRTDNAAYNGCAIGGGLIRLLLPGWVAPR